MVSNSISPCQDLDATRPSNSALPRPMLHAQNAGAPLHSPTDVSSKTSIRCALRHIEFDGVSINSRLNGIELEPSIGLVYGMEILAVMDRCRSYISCRGAGFLRISVATEAS